MATGDDTSTVGGAGGTSGPANPPIGPVNPASYPPRAAGSTLTLATDQKPGNPAHPDSIYHPIPSDVDPSTLSVVTITVPATPQATAGGSTWLNVSIYRFFPTPKRTGLSSYDAAIPCDGLGGPVSFSFQWPTGLQYWIGSHFEMDVPVPVSDFFPQGLDCDTSNGSVQQQGIGFGQSIDSGLTNPPDAPSWSDSYVPQGGS